jgi:uncharacterized protein YggE
MDDRLRLPILLLAGMAVLTGCSPARATPAPSTPGGARVATADTSRITVSGTASMDLPADRARIRLAVETVGATAAEASSSNAEIMQRVLNAVREPAGAGGRIETSGFTLAPRYRQSVPRDEAPEIVGYRATNQVEVVLDEVDRMGGVLDAALGAGANRVTGLDFFASDIEAARLEALREATARARDAAAAVAAALGMVLLSPETIRTSAPLPGPQLEMRALAMQASTTPVEPGSQTVQATVTVTWRIGPGGER